MSESKKLLTYDEKFAVLDCLSNIHGWNDIMSTFASNNDVSLMQYCINNGADNYFNSLAQAYNYNAYDVIAFLYRRCVNDIDRYFAIAFRHGIIKMVIGILKSHKNLDLSLLQPAKFTDPQHVFTIIMANPFVMNREYFVPWTDRDKITMFSTLDNYNILSLVVLKPFMCSDMAREVMEYAKL